MRQLSSKEEKETKAGFWIGFLLPIAVGGAVLASYQYQNKYKDGYKNKYQPTPKPKFHSIYR